MCEPTVCFLQGFLNTCVYVYSNRTMMKWLRSNLICLRIVKRPRFLSHTSPSRPLSIDKHVESGYENEDVPEHKAQDSTTDSELDDLEDDTEWLASALSFSTPRNPRANNPNNSNNNNNNDNNSNNSSSAVTDPEEQTINVLLQNNTNANSEHSQGSHSHSSRSTMSSNPNTNRKSILIGEKHVKNIESKSKRNSAHYYPDVDSEKFVRFGRLKKSMFTVFVSF
jgi:hypothetical protein